MKAIVVKQPYAALIVAGVKEWETRPMPLSGDMRPDGVRGLPGCAVNRGERIAVCAAASKPEEGWRASPGQRGSTVYGDLGGEWVVSGGQLHELCDGRTLPLPTGAVVGTVMVREQVPIVDAEFGWRGEGDTPASAIVVGDGWLELVDVGPGGIESDITDQLPFGWWRDGSTAIGLDDPQPCDPIPVVGKQGVFRLPEDVAAQLAGEGEA